MILFGSGVTDLISPDFGFPTNVVRASNSELFGKLLVLFKFREDLSLESLYDPWPLESNLFEI